MRTEHSNIEDTDGTRRRGPGERKTSSMMYTGSVSEILLSLQRSSSEFKHTDFNMVRVN